MKCSRIADADRHGRQLGGYPARLEADDEVRSVRFLGQHGCRAWKPRSDGHGSPVFQHPGSTGDHQFNGSVSHVWPREMLAALSPTAKYYLTNTTKANGEVRPFSQSPCKVALRSKPFVCPIIWLWSRLFVLTWRWRAFYSGSGRTFLGRRTRAVPHLSSWAVEASAVTKHEWLLSYLGRTRPITTCQLS